MNSPIDEIKKAVAENRTGDALSRLLELSQNNKQLHDAIHIVLAEFNDLTSQRLKGTIDNSEATRRTAVIHDKILVALGAFDSAGRVLPNANFNAKKEKSSSSNGVTILGLLTFICVVIVVIGSQTEEGNKGITSLALIFGLLSFIGLILALIVSAFRR